MNTELTINCNYSCTKYCDWEKNSTAMNFSSLPDFSNLTLPKLNISTENATEVQVIKLCKGSEDNYEHGWTTSFLLVHMVSLVTNIAHAWILGHVTELKGKPYLRVLQHLTFGDIAYNVYNIPMNARFLRNWFFNIKLIYSATAHLVSTVLLAARFNLLILATYEKYVAICHPFHYEKSIVIRHVHFSATLTWLCTLALIVPGWAMFWPQTCWNQVYGPMFSTTNDAGRLYTSAVATIFTIILLVFVIQIIYKLIKMNNSRVVGTNQVDKMLTRAGAYVVTISLIYIFFLFTPVIASAVVRMVARRTYRWIDILSTSMWLSYGFINTFLYGWVSPGYRRQAMRLLYKLKLRFALRKLRVSPATTIYTNGTEMSVTHTSGDEQDGRC